MVSTLLKWFLLIIVVIVLAIIAFFVSMRFHDGPMEIIAGGAFTSGEMVSGPEPDWSFLRDQATVEFQLMDPPRSRVIWLAVDDNRLFVISSYMNTGFGKLWKHWPHHAELDNRALLRVDGKIYKRKLIRLTADQLSTSVMDEFLRKYNQVIDAESIESGNTWLYELAPRKSQGTP